MSPGLNHLSMTRLAVLLIREAVPVSSVHVNVNVPMAVQHLLKSNAPCVSCLFIMGPNPAPQMRYQEKQIRVLLRIGSLCSGKLLEHLLPVELNRTQTPHPHPPKLDRHAMIPKHTRHPRHARHTRQTRHTRHTAPQAHHARQAPQEHQAPQAPQAHQAPPNHPPKIATPRREWWEARKA